uniref:Uncharacterized protein n=1 Tax=Arundo donax TaxID=35708 RepID=A0A0A8YV60_ARUDO
MKNYKQAIINIVFNSHHSCSIEDSREQSIFILHALVRFRRNYKTPVEKVKRSQGSYSQECLDRLMY